MHATANAMRSARRLRRCLSLPEQLLWRQLRQMRGTVKFRRQHAIGRYVAGFYCASAKLVIEVGGLVHEQRQSSDLQRADHLRSLGLTVIRVRASDVLADPEGVAGGLVRLCAAVDGPSTTQPSG